MASVDLTALLGALLTKPAPAPSVPQAPQAKGAGFDFGALLSSLLGSPQIQAMLSSLVLGLVAKAVSGHGKSVTVPASDRPSVDNVPDDKIAPPVVKPPVQAAPSGYTSLKLAIFKAQYNQELFPDQYTDDNKFGLYRPASQAVYNRRSKVWFDATPFKGGQAVQQDEGAKDGILWSPVFHVKYAGVDNVVKAGPAGPDGEPIQVLDPVDGTVGCGVSAWKFAKGFLHQINVGENEGDYEAWVEIPSLGLRSDVVAFTVS